MTLADRYAKLCATPSSINELLPVLRDYGSRCESIAEFGVDIGQSTTAFLMAQPLSLISIDVVQCPELDELFQIGSDCRHLEHGKMLMIGNTFWNFTIQDSRIVSIPITDLLFIDSAHSYDQLTAELTRHHVQVHRWIILHDTETFGVYGEVGPPQLGLTPAVDEFLAAHPEWTERERFSHNNGLLILERVHGD